MVMCGTVELVTALIILHPHRGDACCSTTDPTMNPVMFCQKHNEIFVDCIQGNELRTLFSASPTRDFIIGNDARAPHEPLQSRSPVLARTRPARENGCHPDSGNDFFGREWNLRIRADDAVQFFGVICWWIRHTHNRPRTLLFHPIDATIPRPMRMASCSSVAR